MKQGIYLSGMLTLCRTKILQRKAVKIPALSQISRQEPGERTRRDGAPYVFCRNECVYWRCIASARLNVSTTVCARRSTTATSPSSNAQGSVEKTSSKPTISRSYSTGAARMERISNWRQARASTRGSSSASSQRSGFPRRMHSPLKPLATSSSVPIGRTVVPATARQTMPVSLLSATAAPVPRVIEHARPTISVSAAFKSPPSDLNSYCTLVELEPFPLWPFVGSVFQAQRHSVAVFILACAAISRLLAHHPPRRLPTRRQNHDW